MIRLKSLLIVILILLTFFTYAAANGTQKDTLITNEVTIAYSNSAGATYADTNYVSDTVLGIYGIDATLTTPPLTNDASPGVATTFLGHITNLGNDSQVIFFTNFFTNYSAAGVGPWKFSFENTLGNPATTMTLQPYQGENFYLVVTPTNTANFGEAMTNFFGAYVTNTGLTASTSNYTGLNSTTYGGYWKSSGRWAIAVITDIPVIEIAKYSFVSNSATYLALGGLNGQLVPGSEITYAITFTNSGSANAYGLAFTDPINSDADYVDNSLRYREGLQTHASNVYYYNAATSNITDIDDAETVGTYDCKGRTNAASGQVEFSFGQVIPSGGSGTLYFKVYLK